MNNNFSLPSEGDGDPEALIQVLENFLAILPIAPLHTLPLFSRAAEDEIERRVRLMAEASWKEFDGERISVSRAVETLGATEWPFADIIGRLDELMPGVHVNAMDLARTLGCEDVAVEIADQQPVPIAEVRFEN